MNNHRYTLQLYKGINTRYTCPACGKKKTFTRYIDTHTGEHLADHVGRCNREVNCGYHLKPREYFRERPPLTPPREGNRKCTGAKTSLNNTVIKSSPPSEGQGEVSTLPFSMVTNSMRDYHHNHLCNFLEAVLGTKMTRELIRRYYIGTHDKWDWSTVFWQVDEQMQVRTGKVMLYSPYGKRVRKPYNHVWWVHTRQKDFRLKQCLFGQHLLKDNHNTIAITESEKTALIASAYFPQFTWMATGSLTNLSEEKLLPLKDRNIILYPDLDAIDKWTAIAATLDNCHVSKRLLSIGTDEDNTLGSDLADKLLRCIRHLTG